MSNSDPFYTYWFHPESDSVFAMPKSIDDISASIVAQCNDISLEDYLNKVQKAKELPDGVVGILKNAIRAPFQADVIFGELWYDHKGRFPNGTTIHTSRIVDIRSDGVVVTQHSKYFVQWAAKGGPNKINPNAGVSAEAEETK